MATIDSNLTSREAIGNLGPSKIRGQQKALTVSYLGFDGLEHQGQIVIHKELTEDVRAWFRLAFRLKFPIEKVIPASQFGYDDQKLMSSNATSGFNYRQIAGTNQLSLHAQGKAMDVNPRLNPYIYKVDDEIVTEPPNATRDINAPGTFYDDHPLVQLLVNKGWVWGGSWSLAESGRVDYHHFQKDF